MVLVPLRPSRMARGRQVSGSQVTEMTYHLPGHRQVGGEAT
jgi:hypothetical protein